MTWASDFHASPALIPLSKGRCSITACDAVEDGQSIGLFFSESTSDGIDMQMFEIVSGTRGHPYICSWTHHQQREEYSDQDHNNVDIHCPNQAR